MTRPHVGHVRAERLRAVLLVLAVWAVGFGLAAVFVCRGERRAPPVKVAASEPCILITVDPQSAGPVEAAQVDVCPGDCTAAGAYCVRILAPARGPATRHHDRTVRP